MTNIKHYHNFYLACDVLLLANMFKRFRNTCLEYCKSDLSYCLSSPSLR